MIYEIRPTVQEDLEKDFNSKNYRIGNLDEVIYEVVKGVKLRNDKGVIIGKALLRDYLDGDIFLANFEIFSEYRGQGFGTQQLHKLIDNYGVNCLCVGTTNRCAKHIYDKAGFKVVGESYYDKNVKDYVYYMRLNYRSE